VAKPFDFDHVALPIDLLRLLMSARPNPQARRHFDGLKYRKSGGAWSFLTGISRPSALSM
jgi:hypothetical protein